MTPHVTIKNVPVVSSADGGYHLHVDGRVVVLSAANLLSANVPGKHEFDWHEGPSPVAGRSYDLEVREKWAIVSGLHPDTAHVLATFSADGRKTPPASPYAANTVLGDGLTRSIVLYFGEPVALGGAPAEAILAFSMWSRFPEDVVPGAVIPIMEGPNKVGEAVVRRRAGT